MKSSIDTTQPINIVCVKWGTKFTPNYVNHLYAGVKRNTTVPYIFHCFTDNPTELNQDIKIHKLPYTNIQGWWNKLYLFSKEIDIQGRIVFMDLDTVITGNIDNIIQCTDEFILIRDFFYGLFPNHSNKDSPQSSIMAFNAHQHPQIWDRFIANPNVALTERALVKGGDQAWIGRHQPQRTYYQDKFPDQLVSFKVHCREGLPPDTRIICYHGKPSIVESLHMTTHNQKWVIKPAPWVQQYWREDE